MTIAATAKSEHSREYETVRKVVEIISENWREQPDLASIAHAVDQSPTGLQKLFTRWAGISPKAFLQAVTMDHAKRLMADGLPLLEMSHELGLSGPGRLHDLFVEHEAMSPGTYKSGGNGLKIDYGFHPSPFGTSLVMATQRGLAGLAFADEGEEEIALADMKGRWPNACFTEKPEETKNYAERVFNPGQWQAEQPLRVVLIGTDFEIRVWEGLLAIPFGGVSTYSALGHAIGKNAPRAVGRAVGRNPISFVVPCHRVIGKSGALTGYHWGLTRKRAMLGWEAGISSQA